MRHVLINHSAKLVREALNDAIEKADLIHNYERDLIVLLKGIDDQRFYVRYGYKSLSGFCSQGLRFSRTQTQRIVTEVRRCQTTVNIRLEVASGDSDGEQFLKVDQFPY